MKGASAEFISHIDQESMTLTGCIKLILAKYQPLISNITQTNPAVIETIWAHGYSSGDTVRIVGVRGMTALNRNEYQVTKLDDFSFSIPIDATGLPAYSAKGEARKVIAFTSFIRDLTIDGLLYRATVGYMPRSIKGGSDLSVDNLEIVGLMPNKVKSIAEGLLIQGLSDEDLDVGRFDHAGIELFYINYENPDQGRLILPGSGNIGQVKMRRGIYEAEFRGKTIYLQEQIGELYSKLCRARLGDDIDDYRVTGFGCHVRLDPPTWKASTAYTEREPYDAATGSVVKPTVFNGRHFKCTVAGTSDIAEPTWPTAIGATVADGTATWEAIQALTVFGAVTAVKDSRFFSDDSRTEPPTTGLGVNTGTAQYAIRDANLGGNYFEIDGDLVSYFLTGNTFTVTGSIANDGTYTIVSATLVDGNTRIVPSVTIPDSRANGSITAPFAVATGFFTFGKLTFLTGANIGISKEIKDFRLASYAVVALDQGTQTFMLAGDVSGSFAVDQRLSIAGSTGNNAEYDITAVTYNGGSDQTEITVAQAIADATADGSILAGPGEFEMFERFPFTIEVGDEYMVSAGCDLSKEICKVKFDNVYNLRAEVEIPGTDLSLLAPDKHI